METELRKTSIEAIGNVPWGTHFCQFYQTKEDLTEILVPYFKAGLENNEFCMWITAEPLNARDAQKALKKKIKNLDDYIKKDQIEILEHNQWYTRSENSDPEAIIQNFINKAEYALKKGFDGLRITGNSSWLEKRDWEKFANYEKVVNSVIARNRMLAVCSYCLDNCSPSEIIDVVSNHKFTLIKQNNEWKIIRSSERTKVDEELKLHEIRLQALLNLSKMTDAPEQKILDFVREELIKISQSQFAFLGFMNEDESVLTVDNWSKNTMAQCAITDKPMRFTIGNAGLWGEPVRQRSPFIVNDYSTPHPMKKGFPRGHVSIERFLGIPVFDGEHIVAVAGVANKLNDYDESDIRAIESMMNDTWRLLRQKQNEKEIKNLAKFPSENKNPVLRFSSDGTIIYANKASSIVLETWGCNKGERIPQPCNERITKAFETGKGSEFEFTCDNGRIFSVTLAPVVEAGYVNAYGYEITDRKDMESQQQLAGKILECLNRESVGVDLIHDVLKLIKKTTGFDAVGIRHQEDEDFPYFEVNGFPEEFVKAEDRLCSHKETGEPIFDSKGRPALECICGIVLSSRTESTLPFFTEGGSFWTNSTSELLTCTLQERFQVPIRNRCNKAGYESVALIPLRSGDEIVGLLQLNDTRRGCFTDEKVRFFEEIGASIGIGLARIRAERKVENLARFPSENPYPVMRIAKDGLVLYANTAGTELLVNLGCTVGMQAPEHWYEHVLKILELGESKQLEIVCKKNRIFSMVMAPIVDAGYVNVYGTDITDRKQAEEQITSLARFPSENPYPVLRIAKDGRVLYANITGSDLLGNLGCNVGTQAPEHWQENILRTLKSRQGENFEAVFRDRIFSFTIAPVTDSGYANVYGTDITERKHAEESLRKHQQQLEGLVQSRTAELTEANKKLMMEIEGRKQLEKEILNISEREQKRIGRELHDSIGQQFTGIAFLTKVLEQKLAAKLPDEATNAAEIKKLVNQAMDQMRSLARGLHPVELDAGSLTSALQELAATTENLFGIRCIFEYDELISIEDTEVATHLYRITQEAITNAIKHGKAKIIRIELFHEKDKSILTIKNDGLDFPEEFEARGSGMGLQIMDHRADIIGASFDIHKAAEGGTIVTCSISNKH